MSHHPYSMSNNTTILPEMSVRNHNIIYYFVPLYAILFVVGTFGNGLVIISIFRSSRLRTVTNTYLLNIAIADFLLLLSIPFLIINILANGWIFGNVLCKMYYNFIYINQYVSSLLLAALSFDRYLAVCHPIRAIEFRTSTKCAVIITGCWLISVLFLCPTWIFATVLSEQHVVWLGYQVQKCVIDFPSVVFKVPPEVIFTYYAFFLGFLFPVSMITTFYVLVLIRLRHIRRKHKSEIKQRSHRKVTRVVLAVITAYFICWVPYWFLQILITIHPLIDSLRRNSSSLPTNTGIRFLKELTHLTTIIGYANNCLNPVLYVFLSESFREEYLIVLRCFRPGEMFADDALNPVIAQRPSYEYERNRRSSVQFTKRRDPATRETKHSVAIDELPSHYRSFSVCFHRENESKRWSNSSSSMRDYHREKSKGQRTMVSREKPSRKHSTHHEQKVLMVTLSLASPKATPRINDDGGVYCGE